jgi:hypothetical protein
MTAAGAKSAGRALRARALLLAGTAIAGAGVVLAIAGVIVGPLFVPGTWIILAAAPVLAVAGIDGIAEARGDAA